MAYNTVSIIFDVIELRNVLQVLMIWHLHNQQTQSTGRTYLLRTTAPFTVGVRGSDIRGIWQKRLLISHEGLSDFDSLIVNLSIQCRWIVACSPFSVHLCLCHSKLSNSLLSTKPPSHWSKTQFLRHYQHSITPIIGCCCIVDIIIMDNSKHLINSHFFSQCKPHLPIFKTQLLQQYDLYVSTSQKPISCTSWQYSYLSTHSPERLWKDMTI